MKQLPIIVMHWSIVTFFYKLNFNAEHHFVCMCMLSKALCNVEHHAYPIQKVKMVQTVEHGVELQLNFPNCCRAVRMGDSELVNIQVHAADLINSV